MRILPRIGREVISLAIGFGVGGFLTYLHMNPEQYIAETIGNPPDWLNINFLSLLLISGLGAAAARLGIWYWWDRPRAVDKAKASKDEQKTAQQARDLLAHQGIPWNQYAYIDWVSRGRLEVVRLFWDGGMPVNVTAADGRTVVHFAAGNGRLDLLKEAINRGSDPNAQSNIYETPLIEAVNRCREHIVRELVANNVDLNSQTSVNGFGGCTALFFAAQYGYTEIARQLLNAGTRADLATIQGMTPLMVAAYRGHPELVSLLLDNGAEITKTDQQGANALDYALAEQGPGNQQGQRVLSEAGLRSSEPKKQFSSSASGAGFFHVTWILKS